MRFMRFAWRVNLFDDHTQVHTDMKVDQYIVGSMAVCCYVVSCPETKKAVIIDPGGDEQRLVQAVDEQQLDVQYIIATHGHPDHVCGIRPLKQSFGATLIMHEEDDDFFNMANNKAFFGMLGLEESPPADMRVRDGDSISFGTVRLQVIHTPGHTPGGICLYGAPHLFTGDSLFVGGIGRTDFPGGSHAQLISSITSRLMVLPADTVVWPGHGYGGSRSTIGDERSTNPYLR